MSDSHAPPPDPGSADMGPAAAEVDPTTLPPWRRPRPLSRKLAMALIVTALLAVTTFGALNFFAARELLVEGTEDQLAALGAARANSIEAGSDRLVAEISAVSSDLSLARQLEGFTTQFAALEDEELTVEQQAELERWYQERVLDPLNNAGLGPFGLNDVLPRTSAGKWLQYHYTVRPRGEAAPVDAGDGTAYSELNAEVTDAIRDFSLSKGGGDVLLIDDSGTIVYSLDKRNDVGTNLESGPYADSALAQLVTESLPRAGVGTTLLTDFTVSATGRASLYAVSPVPGASRVLGAVAVEIPVDVLNQVASSQGDWNAIGLSEGDSYIVGSDLKLQSEPRAWIKDPEGYLDRLRSGDEADQAEAELIELFGSPVGVQVIDTTPVEAALDGDIFRGSARNYFGEPTFSAAESFSATGRQWVVVTEVPRSAAIAPLIAYVFRILLVLLIVLPVVAGFGIWLARLLTRPIRPTVEAAEAIVEGERHPDVDTSRVDEFGDLGRRLTAMAASLAAREAELADEYDRKRQLLLAVLPPHLVDDQGNIVGTGEAAAHATVVAVNLNASDAHPDREQVSDGLRHAAQLAEQVASETSLQRVRVAADRFLFLASMDREDAGADSAITFAVEYRRRLESEEEVSLDLHIGLSSGAVATGLLDTGSLTFGAWGEPVRRALALASLSRVDEVLIDASTAHAGTRDRWRLAPAHDIVGLDDEPMDLYTLDVDASGLPVPS
ncbi:MAG: adenylate/guanylate cyclase domain-containing protein [Actinomycetota bacterium]|nr:adenylate/guanylate cyclase domain-containing protein [Actinomycetota bacterium]